jgi:hypothetical protein
MKKNKNKMKNIRFFYFTIFLIQHIESHLFLN